MPYCVKKCAYCDFVSYTDRFSTANEYCDTVIDELMQYDAHGYSVETVFFGGGTPSAVAPEIIMRILSAIGQKYSLANNAEITLECNPCTLDEDKLCKYRSYGINRLSIGVQSFDDNVLKILGRVHDANTARKSIESAKKSGFDNINVDLMFAVPHQTEKSLSNSIDECASFGVRHISLYSLILEDGTRLKRDVDSGALCAVDDDTDRGMYHTALKMLKEKGYLQYEVSNFAKPGYESRHNTAYWERKEYIGLGCAAHSFFGNKRYSNTENLDEYLNGINVKANMLGGTLADKNSAAEEILMLGLRMNKGINLTRFSEDTGFELLEKCARTVAKLESEGLIELSCNRLYATDKGRDVLNYVILELVQYF